MVDYTVSKISSKDFSINRPLDNKAFGRSGIVSASTDLVPQAFEFRLIGAKESKTILT